MYYFPRADPSEQATVRFDLRPESIGMLRGRLRLDDGPAVEFSTFVYP